MEFARLHMMMKTMLWMVVVLPFFEASAAQAADFVCQVPDVTDEELMILRNRNCMLVRESIRAFSGGTDGVVSCTSGDMFSCHINASASREGMTEWDKKAEGALVYCKQSQEALDDGSYGDLRQATNLAINAYGSVMLEGHQCCTLMDPPYCVEMTYRSHDFCTPLLFLLFVLLFAFVAFKSCLNWLRQVRKKETEEAPMPKQTNQGAPQSAVDLERKLMAIWSASCLAGKGDASKELPHASEWGKAAASLFASLASQFDFQADSVCCQFEHLVSLWRSHACVVTDRAIQDEIDEKGALAFNKAIHHVAKVAEETVLKDALEDLHRDLTEGFHQWRKRLASYEEAEVPTQRERRHRGLLAAAKDDSAMQLVEISVYLLVWGEAGNVRFMPELLYFIMDLAIAAEGRGGLVYERVGKGTSGLYLSKVIRPVYNVVFEEWYKTVEIDKGGRDKKTLHDKFSRFLPADTANYDDWDELFCSPSRLVENLVLDDGTRLFDLPHGQRFTALTRVNWRSTLAAKRTKTHREVHSLWGVYASIHRVVLLHVVLFLVLLFMAAEQDVTDLSPSVLGRTRAERFAVIGLLVPVHGLTWNIARWEVTGACYRPRNFSLKEMLRILRHVAFAALWLVPVGTYLILRQMEKYDEFRPHDPFGGLFAILLIHYVVSAIGIGVGLFIPIYATDAIWPLTRGTFCVSFWRYMFWAAVLTAKCTLAYFGLISKILHSVQKLRLSQFSTHFLSHHNGLFGILMSAQLSKDLMEEVAVWGAAFFLFCADTQLWAVLGCTALGVGYVFVQRRGHVRSFVVEDAGSKIPQRFCSKVLPYAPCGTDRVPVVFIGIWDRVVEYLRYEGKVTSREMGDLSYCTDADSNVKYGDVSKPIRTTEVGASWPTIFRGTRMAENLMRKYGGDGHLHGWPNNREAKWRLQALARGLGLPIPRPFRAPYVPGLTVLIPHYGESILAIKDLDLLRVTAIPGITNGSPLMDWLADKYQDEFDNFSEKMTMTGSSNGTAWPKAGMDWKGYREEHWDKLSFWASMRMQTLFRTVSGMMLYHQALQAHFEAQGDKHCKLGLTWDPSDCFTCVVAMQMYAYFNAVQLEHTNIMFRKFAKSLKVAFIDSADCEPKAEADVIDGVSDKQQRRYYSCLIDGSCAQGPSGKRTPIWKIELPGYPILGDGKGDNQNTAIPFTRGTFVQCIDANQGAYFEQMLLLPCVLGEFRSRRAGDGGAKKIVGFPEHITSDFGSVGDFAASAELAFGTILQRSYCLLGARMHYGHPDIMNKELMMQQGGVSKATKTLNLSEDIFAGMDFTLRGGGRTIKHREYFHLAKGRDLGFNTVLAFFSKLSSGAGEQLITRQTMRLGQLLPLPEYLTFYYAHMGYYINQWLVSWGLPVLTLAWLIVILNGCEDRNDMSISCHEGIQNASSVIAEAWQYIYSRSLLLVFMIAQMAPVFMENWMQAGIVSAMSHMLKQLLTMSPIMFIFQAKVIGFYTMNELKFGGATYVATGRGLPTERRPFIGTVASDGQLVIGGLYTDYARITYYDGASLVALIVLILVSGGTVNTGPQLIGMMISLWLVSVSWLFAPFIFNPYQFRASCFTHDLKAWFRFFFDDYGNVWKKWYMQDQVKPRRGFRATILDLSFFIELFWVLCCFVSLNAKTAFLIQVSESWRRIYVLMLMPPIFLPWIFCIGAACCGACLRRCRGRREVRRKAKKPTVTSYTTLTRNPWSFARSDADPSPDNEDESGEDVVDPSSDEVSLEEEAEPRKECCPSKVPLALISLVVTLLTMLEIYPSIAFVSSIGWTKASFLALLLKIFWLRLVQGLAMTAIRSSCYQGLSCYGRPLELWLDSVCMARDMGVSAVIYLTLLPLVILSSISESICPTFSIHHLLIYRQPGHTTREIVEKPTIWGSGRPHDDLEDGETSGSTSDEH